MNLLQTPDMLMGKLESMLFLVVCLFSCFVTVTCNCISSLSG